MTTRSVVAVLTSVAFLFGSTALYADPGNGKGNPQTTQGNQGGQGNQGNKGNQGNQGNKGNQANKGNQGNQGGQGNKGNQSQNYTQGGRYNGPQVDVGGIRVIIGDSRDYWSPGPALPPGIQKNLARGKPLPPGIAKKLDGRMLGRLPHYDGYEWQQAGTDLILVAIATGIIYEVLHNALD